MTKTRVEDYTMFAELDNAIRRPNATAEAGFWRLAAWLKLAKRHREDKVDLILDRLASKRLLGYNIFSVPNALSVSRTFPLAPMFWLAVSYGLPAYIPISILVMAGETDWFDGVFARRAGTSKLGGLIDACSDKVFMIVCFVSLYRLIVHRLFWWLLGVETALLGIAAFAIYQMQIGFLPKTTNTDSIGFGKCKFAVECAGVLMLLVKKVELGNELLWTAFILAILSAFGKAWQIWGPKIRVS